MYVCLCSVSPVASCSHGRVVRHTVCEHDDPSSNPARCSFFFLFFSFFFFFFLSLLARADICTAELATWGVGPNVRKMHFNLSFMTEVWKRDHLHSQYYGLETNGTARLGEASVLYVSESKRSRYNVTVSWAQQQNFLPLIGRTIRKF